jgi:hypothetical protein
MLESTCCLTYDTTDDSKNNPCDNNNWTCQKPFKCSDLPQGKTISELCCSGRADLVGSVYKCRKSISLKNALVVVGSSVASGYHLIGQGCQGCTDPNDPNDTPIKCGNTEFISPEKCESNQSSSCSKDCCSCYTSYIAWYNTNFSNSVSDTYNFCHPGSCTASTLWRLQNKDIKTMSPKFVFIGLSTGNERYKYDNYGCANKEVSELGTAFVSGMENIIKYLNPDITKLDIKIIIGGTYTNSESAQFTQSVQAFKDLHTKYKYPMVDFMGVLVDINSNTLGSWAPGFEQVDKDKKITWANTAGENNNADGNHPNGLGSQEMFFAIVPSMFDAYDKIENYQDLDIKWQNYNKGQPGPIEFNVPDNQTMHSWSIQFTVIKKNQQTDVFKITGTSYTTNVPVPGSYPIKLTDDSIITLTDIQQGDTVLITHSYSCATTIIYIERSGNILTPQKHNQRFIPSQFLLIGSDNIFSNLCIWRTCLIPQYFDKQTLQHQSYFSRASLELYAPLDTNYSNMALSLSRLSNDIINNMNLINYTNSIKKNNSSYSFWWIWLLLVMTVLLIIALIFILSRNFL